MTRPYHHGDLPAALLAAAEALLAEGGVEALTLRAVARRVGVSHMAPAPHFGDLTGLLSELAAVGYQRFTQALVAAREHPGGRSPAAATGHAYVAFAQAQPALFLLMFRPGRLDFARPALAAAAAAASAALAGTVNDGGPARNPGLHLDVLGKMVGNWALVHGFALLLIDGRLAGALAAPACGGDVGKLLDAVLAA